MRIGMVLDAPFPPDIRVEKEARTLTEAGHQVFVLASRKTHPLLREPYQGFTIHRFDLKQHRLLKSISRDYSHLFFLDPVWKKGIAGLVREHQLDILHVHDLPLVKTALQVARKHTIPLVADFHENYPAHVQALKRPDLNWRYQWYLSPTRWERHQKKVASQVTHIIAIIDEFKTQLVEEYSVPADKITIIRNTPDLNNLILPVKTKVPDSGFIISYIGSFGPHRGLDIAIKGMPHILSQVPQARLVIVGKGKNQPALEHLVTTLGLGASVSFLGWKNSAEIPHYFNEAQVGIIPHLASRHTDISAPNKLFEYMYYKVPLVVSDRPALKRITQETRAGLTFTTGDPEDFANKVLQIYAHPGNYGACGHQAVTEKYNWHCEGAGLVRLYDKLGS